MALLLALTFSAFLPIALGFNAVNRHYQQEGVNSSYQEGAQKYFW